MLVVVDPADYPRVLEQMARPGGPSLAFRFELMQKAFAHTAQFDALIAADAADDPRARAATFARGAAGRPDVATDHGSCATARTRTRRPLGPGARRRTGGAWEIHQGKELSYTNLLDLDAAARIALEFTEPAAVVIKHTNPCGIATGATIAEAYVRARDADPLSAFGGIVGLNRAIDADDRAALDVDVHRGGDRPVVRREDAQAILAKKTNLRVVTADFEAMANAADPWDGDMRSAPRCARSSAGC